MSWWRTCTFAALLGLAPLVASPASAAPAGLGKMNAATMLQQDSVTKVGYRGWRHRGYHRHHHHRHHGRKYRYYRYGAWPGINLYIGRGHRHHGHHRHHRRGWGW